MRDTTCRAMTRPARSNAPRGNTASEAPQSVRRATMVIINQSKGKRHVHRARSACSDRNKNRSVPPHVMPFALIVKRGHAATESSAYHAHPTSMHRKDPDHAASVRAARPRIELGMTALAAPKARSLLRATLGARNAAEGRTRTRRSPNVRRAPQGHGATSQALRVTRRALRALTDVSQARPASTRRINATCALQEPSAVVLEPRNAPQSVWPGNGAATTARVASDVAPARRPGLKARVAPCVLRVDTQKRTAPSVFLASWVTIVPRASSRRVVRVRSPPTSVHFTARVAGRAGEFCDLALLLHEACIQ